MKATIRLNNGDYIYIDNLQRIQQHESSYANPATIENFEDFQLYETQYTFVGNLTLLVSASEITYVYFEN